MVRIGLRTKGNKITPYLQDFKTDGKAQKAFKNNPKVKKAQACVKQNAGDASERNKCLRAL